MLYVKKFPLDGKLFDKRSISSPKAEKYHYYYCYYYCYYYYYYYYNYYYCYN